MTFENFLGLIAPAWTMECGTTDAGEFIVMLNRKDQRHLCMSGQETILERGFEVAPTLVRAAERAMTFKSRRRAA